MKSRGFSKKVNALVKVNVDHETCILCQTCVNICPMGVFQMEDDRVEPVREDQCIICRGCEAACPVEAIVIEE